MLPDNLKTLYVLFVTVVLGIAVGIIGGYNIAYLGAECRVEESYFGSLDWECDLSGRRWFWSGFAITATWGLLSTMLFALMEIAGSLRGKTTLISDAD